MRQPLQTYAIALSLVAGFAPHLALAAEPVVGVNVVDIDHISAPQQDALVEQLRQAGVTTVRAGIGDKFTHFIIRAYERGIGVVAIIYPTQGSTNTNKRPADPSIGLNYAQLGITGADPAKFKAFLEAQLAPLEAAGVRLTAFELGNEINGPFFNGDFLPAQATGRMLGLADLNNANDAEGRAIAASYRAYLRVAAALKDVRDHAKVNRNTPIVSAGLVSAGPAGKRPGQRLDGVAASDTLEFMRQNGLDGLVDGYGVHAYPAADPRRTVPALVDALGKDAFAACTASKPCWLTEWGFDNRDKPCPADDRVRVHLIATMRSALKQFAEQGKLAASVYYSWAGHPGELGSTIFRCGALTDAGKLALRPM